MLPADPHAPNQAAAPRHAPWWPHPNWRALASPPVYCALAQRLAPGLAVAGVLLTLLGLAWGWFNAPVDAQQGLVYRIIYVHVPAAWMSMFLYVVAAGHAAAFLVWRTRVSAALMRALLPTGAWMTALALATGSLWGWPTWGTWWVWDARLTTELLLLLIYLGLLAVSQLVEDPRKTDRAVAVMLLVGLFNIPLIYFSVVFWNTLHQGYSVGVFGQATVHAGIKQALLLCTLGFWFMCAALALARARWALLRAADRGWA